MKNSYKIKEESIGNILLNYSNGAIDYYIFLEAENKFKKSLKGKIEKIMKKINKFKITPINNYKIKQSTKLTMQKATFEIRKLKD